VSGGGGEGLGTCTKVLAEAASWPLSRSCSGTVSVAEPLRDASCSTYSYTVHGTR